MLLQKGHLPLFVFPAYPRWRASMPLLQPPSHRNNPSMSPRSQWSCSPAAAHWSLNSRCVFPTLCTLTYINASERPPSMLISQKGFLGFSHMQNAGGDPGWALLCWFCDPFLSHPSGPFVRRSCPWLHLSFTGMQLKTKQQVFLTSAFSKKEVWKELWAVFSVGLTVCSSAVSSSCSCLQYKW